MPSNVLVSWIAVNNDPFERDRSGGTYRLVGGKPVAGPTFTLLFDPDSPYAGKVSDIVLLHGAQSAGEDSRQARALSETLKELKARDPRLRVHLEPWDGDDPTDHGQILDFLRQKLPEIRRKFLGKELVVHVSPGTPSMQTVLVLMGETGFIDPPFALVKSYRKEERRGRPAVVPVRLGIDTFYKAYRAARPVEVASEEDAVVWDPAKFRTERMRTVFLEARRFAQLNVPILLLGERGTGKTTLAGWVRSHSPYRVPDRDSHWPAVACGQYTPETMRAELFGYKRGAFTGAMKDHEGLLAMAHKDSLFLDEIGDVSRDLQRLLIKALEEKRYMRLGDDRTRDSDFRLIAATNLTDEDLRMRLDPDFLDRVSMLKLRLPALRDVREEIPWLWEMVFDQAARRAGTGLLRLAQSHHRSIVGQLSRHPLPGNLRDLFRVAYRIIAARADQHEPLSPEAAVDYGLACLAPDQSDQVSGDLPKAVARAFADSQTLDALIPPEGALRTKDVERTLKAYLAQELRRIAKVRGVEVEKICDVTDRALREWVSPKDGKK